MEVAHKIFSLVEPEFQFKAFKKDGNAMHAGEQAFEVEASIHTILKCERLVLNCMQRMSGIATLTRQYADKLKGYATKILDTRKTTPNFRLLEKEAVRIGGGINHRFGLYETRTIDDVGKVCSIAKGKVFRIMLDNFSPQQIAEALQIINHEFETEASGGINLDNITDYAATGVDYISVGGLIHQAKSLDLSLKAELK